MTADSNLPAAPSPYRSRWRPRRWWQWLLFGLACLATLVALFYTEENLRGRHAWNAYQRQLIAQGETLDFRGLIPPPVADDQNLALIPLFSSLPFRHPRKDQTNWPPTKSGLERIDITLAHSKDRPAPKLCTPQTTCAVDLDAWQEFYRGNTNYPQPTAPQSAAADVLLALSKFDPPIQQLETEAAARPLSRFPIDYDEPNVAAILLPHLANLRNLASFLQLRAVARLETGDTNGAFRDVKLAFRVADTVRSEPFVISHLVRTACQGLALQSWKEGLARHRWSEAQLVEMQNWFSGVNLFAEWRRCMRAERLFSTEIIDLIQRRQIRWDDVIEDDRWGFLPMAIPSGWLDQNKLFSTRLYQDWALPTIDDRAHRVYLEFATRLEERLRSPGLHPFEALARVMLPAIVKTAQKTASTQTLLDEAAIACALERSRLSAGTYPDRIEALVPRFMAQLPHDVVTGEPLKYRREGEGYLLYSVGANGTDDHGAEPIDSRRPKAPADLQRGDWVWRVPLK